MARVYYELLIGTNNLYIYVCVVYISSYVYMYF